MTINFTVLDDANYISMETINYIVEKCSNKEQIKEAFKLIDARINKEGKK